MSKDLRYTRPARAETESDHVSIAPESYLKLPICLVGLEVSWVPWRRYDDIQWWCSVFLICFDD